MSESPFGDLVNGGNNAAPTVTPSSAPAGNAAPAAQAPTQAAPVVNTQPVARSISDFQLSTNFLRPTLMTKAGEKFVDDLRSESARAAEAVHFSLNIQPVSYIESCAGIAVTDAPTNPNYVFLLVFADSLQDRSASKLPADFATRILKQSGLLPKGYDVNMHTGEVFTRSGAELGKTPSLIGVKTVDPTDYVNPEKIMRLIYNRFSTLMHIEHTMTINSILNPNESLYISTNLDTVRNFTEFYSMDTVPPRCDYGFVAYIAPTAYLADLKNRNQMNLVNTASEGFKPLVGCAGYTTFMLKPQNFYSMNNQLVANPYAPVPPPFMPAVHFEVISPVSSLRLAVLAQALAAQYFIKDRLWMAPFNTFSENSPFNLGRLLLNQQERVFDVVDSQQKLNQYFMQYIDGANPLLIMDVVEGRDCITGSNTFAMPTMAPAVAGLLNAFFEDPNFMIVDPKNGNAPWMINNMVWRNIIGIYQNERSEYRDIRELDQLRVGTLLDPKQVDPSIWDLLQNQSFKPQALIEGLKEHFKTVKPLYLQYAIPLAATFVNSLASRIVTALGARIYTDIIESSSGNVMLGQFVTQQNYAGNLSSGGTYQWGYSQTAGLNFI